MTQLTKKFTALGLHFLTAILDTLTFTTLEDMKKVKRLNEIIDAVRDQFTQDRKELSKEYETEEVSDKKGNIRKFIPEDKQDEVNAKLYSLEYDVTFDSEEQIEFMQACAIKFPKVSKNHDGTYGLKAKDDINAFLNVCEVLGVKEVEE